VRRAWVARLLDLHLLLLRGAVAVVVVLSDCHRNVPLCARNSLSLSLSLARARARSLSFSLRVRCALSCALSRSLLSVCLSVLIKYCESSMAWHYTRWHTRPLPSSAHRRPRPRCPHRGRPLDQPCFANATRRGGVRSERDPRRTARCADAVA
jgi:hypothetical protein